MFYTTKTDLSEYNKPDADSRVLFFYLNQTKSQLFQLFTPPKFKDHVKNKSFFSYDIIYLFNHFLTLSFLFSFRTKFFILIQLTEKNGRFNIFWEN